MDTTAHPHAPEAAAPALRFSASGSAQNDFMVRLLPGVYEEKLLNLAEALDADVRKATKQEVCMRVGKKSWLPFSGHGELPVELTLTVNPDTPCAKLMTHIAVEIRPLASASREALEERSNWVIREVHSCLIGHELELA